MYHVGEMFICNLRFPCGVFTKNIYEKPYFSFQNSEIRVQKVVRWTVVAREPCKGKDR